MIHPATKIIQITCDWCGNTTLVAVDDEGRPLGNIEGKPNTIEGQLIARGWFGEVFGKDGRFHSCKTDCARKLKALPARTTP